VITDLVSPWCTAIEARDSARARSAFRSRHAALLESLRRHRAPLADVLPLSMDSSELRPLARRAADPDSQQILRAALTRAVELGADGCGHVVLLAGDGTGDAVEPLPWADGDAVLFLDRAADDTARLAALGRGVAALTRWRAIDSRSAIRRLARAPWDRWQACRDFPLREWVYTAGLGLHLSQALLPDLPPHRILGVSQAAFARLRQREKVFHALLAGDLDRSGIGLVLRWLSPGAPVGPRTVGGLVLPPLAGHYLAWRMLAERVARVGLREAIRMEA
jgi:hypothetical protein